ncbi:MAG TPA: phosphotransferase [Myxococcota bacterium]|nr:phosphotransferase [Myxococcota bacterium]
MTGDDEAVRERVRSAVARALGARVREIELLSAGLGLRRFARVRLAPGGPAPSLIARVEAPEDPAGRPAGLAPEPPLEPIRALLEREGLPVPRRFGADDGVELLEDLGDVSLAELAPQLPPAERSALYADACALVPRLQRVADPGGVAAFSRRLDAAQLAYKGELFATHGLGRGPSAAERALVRDAFARIAQIVEAAPQRLAHRDFQSANLHVRETPQGRRLAMIDLQGAWLAPPEYDLVCLLRDSYVELPEAEIAQHFEATRLALPDRPDPDVSALRFALLGVARKGKDYARFLDVASRRGDRRALAFLPTTLRHLRASARAAAARDAAWRALAELVASLPEPTCAP